MTDKELEAQTVRAFIEWRADPSVLLEMRCKDGSDTWGPCVLADDCWWRHSYYRLMQPATVPLVIPVKPKKAAAAAAVEVAT